MPVLTRHSPAWVTLLGLLVSIGASAQGTPNDRSAAEEPYVLILSDSDSSPEHVFQTYSEITGQWEEISRFNLLRSGRHLELTRDMISSDKFLAKMAGFYGETEVRRSFDQRFIPVVKNLLLREGDVIRTWRRSGGRILFEDKSFVLIRSNGRARLMKLDAKDSEVQVRLELLEGTIWSNIKNWTGGRFEVKTPTASTIIRGTDFRLKVESEAVSRLEVLEGSVELNVGTESVSVPASSGLLSRAGESLGEPQSLPRAPASLVAPQPEQVFRGEPFDQNFEWSAVEGAQGYRVEIARDESFFDLVVEREVTGDPAVRILALAPGTYFWRVTAINRIGFEGPPSGYSYFVVVQIQP
jgi:hypothetical protein